MSQAMMSELRQFVEDEMEATRSQLFDTWERSLPEKLLTGHSQSFTKLEEGPSRDTVWAYPDPEQESRFREGDLLRLHLGDPFEEVAAQLVLEEEADDCWLLSGHNLPGSAWERVANQLTYADPDMIDLSGMYQQALDDIARSPVGRQLVLPLLSGALPADQLNSADYDAAADIAESGYGFNEDQVDAVGWACGARYLACIQGPPGTGKTRVLALIAKLLVTRGERILVTSHTHMAINNALNRIYEEGVETIKVGKHTSLKGLRPEVECYETFREWEDCPKDAGYVIGATPFATCTSRLEEHLFDTVIFDEASQVTSPLALMAMRRAKRFVFIGDHRQLPPVVSSLSVLDIGSASVFARLLSAERENVVTLNTTYRMNASLSAWPSEQFYAGLLQSDGANKNRRFSLPNTPGEYQPILNGDHSLVFIESTGRNSRSINQDDAVLIAKLCKTCIDSGLSPKEIGVVVPFRNQGRRIRTMLRRYLGPAIAKLIVADTVERMQGQEKELVILNMTATDPQYLCSLAGFLFQPQRMNVAVTRAKTKTIVIGPEVDDEFFHEEPEIGEWVDMYRSLIASCHRTTI
ncbi:DEAD/DEAH box helicase [Marinobacterium litorale]|uniref:DEAD/DEAH box helicase n=1 Tax=Marinobacterium litorale TaxID=404770 RepID=UPI00041C68FD|nr:AAA domain-containing protein [Marinobacterium litorale]